MVVEAELDRGRGPVATILIQDGTLNRGDVILAGGAHGKVRAMHDAMGNQLESAGPSTPVVVIGLADVPSAGDPVHVLNDMKKAQEIELGFEPSKVVETSFDLRLQGYEEAQGRALQKELLERVGSLPGVAAAVGVVEGAEKLGNRP